MKNFEIADRNYKERLNLNKKKLLYKEQNVKIIKKMRKVMRLKPPKKIKIKEKEKEESSVYGKGYYTINIFRFIKYT